MDLNKQSSLGDNFDTKAEFRKPSIEAASRKYRRHSPVSYSSSSDGSPKRKRSSSPNLTRHVAENDVEKQPRKKDGRRELDRDSSRSRHGRSGDSYRYTDRQSSRSYRGSSRHDAYVRRDKEGEVEKDYQRSTFRSGREPRGGTQFDHNRQESEHDQSKDYFRDVDKYSHDTYDSSSHKNKDKDPLSERSGRRYIYSEEKERDRNTKSRGGRDDMMDNRRSLGDYKSEGSFSYEESRGNRNDSTSGDDAKHRLKEAYEGGHKELDGQKLDKEDRRKHNERKTNWDKDQNGKELRGKFDHNSVSANEKQESPAENPKSHRLDDDSKYVSKFSSAPEEKKFSSSKQAEDDKMVLPQGQVSDAQAASHLSAAKVAAIKAAELVNKNLVGGSFMTAEQKKKLLWGNKKTSVAEESGHRWDAALFTDRERQEKFNKLMGVKGELNVDQKPNSQDGNDLLRAEKEKELQLDLEKQYTAGLRRRDGRTVGLGL